MYDKSKNGRISPDCWPSITEKLRGHEYMRSNVRISNVKTQNAQAWIVYFQKTHDVQERRLNKIITAREKRK